MIRIADGKAFHIQTLNFPDKVDFAITVATKRAMLSCGLFCVKFGLNEIKEQTIKYYFGEMMGGRLITLCQAINNGEYLNGDLLTKLEMKEETCIEEFVD